MDQFDKLSIYCQFGRLEKVKNELANPEDDLDLLECDGSLFRIAARYEDGKILSKLLKHYKKTKLSGDPESYEYKFAKKELIDVVEDIIDLEIASEESMKLLEPFMPEDDDANSRADELADVSDFTFDADDEIDNKKEDNSDVDSISSMSINSSTSDNATNTWDNPFSTEPSTNRLLIPNDMIAKLTFAGLIDKPLILTPKLPNSSIISALLGFGLSQHGKTEANLEMIEEESLPKLGSNVELEDVN